MGATKFMDQLSEVVEPIRLALIMHVSSIITVVITVITTAIIRYQITYASLVLSIVLLTAALTKLHKALGRAKELYLTRIRDAVWSQRAMLDVNRESEELWIRARLYVVALLVMVITSLSLMVYLLIRSLSLAVPYNVITWINLTLVIILSLMEVYVMARVNCAVWI
ncbi:MAG: hypothetical protein ACP5L5_08030 [Vulcanisaeta sp.]|uniref:hypothetical protein n=1 Tax=Vulcanisaeta sp. TaxID=2020871 RepID=UPI003D096C15